MTKQKQNQVKLSPKLRGKTHIHLKDMFYREKDKLYVDMTDVGSNFFAHTNYLRPVIDTDKIDSKQLNIKLREQLKYMWDAFYGADPIVNNISEKESILGPNKIMHAGTRMSMDNFMKDLMLKLYLKDKISLEMADDLRLLSYKGSANWKVVTSLKYIMYFDVYMPNEVFGESTMPGKAQEFNMIANGIIFNSIGGKLYADSMYYYCNFDDIEYLQDQGMHDLNESDFSIETSPIFRNVFTIPTIETLPKTEALWDAYASIFEKFDVMANAGRNGITHVEGLYSPTLFNDDIFTLGNDPNKEIGYMHGADLRADPVNLIQYILYINRHILRPLNMLVENNNVHYFQPIHGMMVLPVLNISIIDQFNRPIAMYDFHAPTNFQDMYSDHIFITHSPPGMKSRKTRIDEFSGRLNNITFDQIYLNMEDRRDRKNIVFDDPKLRKQTPIWSKAHTIGTRMDAGIERNNIRYFMPGIPNHRNISFMQTRNVDINYIQYTYRLVEKSDISYSTAVTFDDPRYVRQDDMSNIQDMAHYFIGLSYNFGTCNSSIHAGNKFNLNRQQDYADNFSIIIDSYPITLYKDVLDHDEDTK